MSPSRRHSTTSPRLWSTAENFTDACEILLGLGRRAEAFDQCRRAVKVDPEYARAQEMLRRAEGR